MLENFKSSVVAVAKWLRSVYSESDGTGSATRFHLGLLFVFVIGVGSAFAVLVFRKQLSIGDYDAFLGAATLFLTSVGGFLYGINKAADVMQTKNNNGGNQN